MEKRLISKIAATGIFISHSYLAISQNIVPVDAGDSLQLNLSEVVVTANRYGSIRLKTPEALHVLDAGKVQQQQLRTAPEALSLTPGVFIQKTNHGGGSPFIRGLTGNQTLLLIDGIRLSNSVVRYGPNQYLNTIDVFSAGKFEVMRGSGSVQYGSDAIGGTIQAFSHSLKLTEMPELHGAILGRIATHGMEKTGHGNITFSGSRAALRAAITARSFGDLVGGDTTGKQIPTGYDELDFDLKGLVKLSRSSELTMLFQRVHQAEVPVYHKVVLENYRVNRMHPQERILGYLRLNQDISAGILQSAVLTASIQKSNELRESSRNGSAILRSENDRVRTFAFSAEALASDGNLWRSNTGFEIYNDLVNSTRSDLDLSFQISTEKRGLYPDGATMTSLAFYTLHTLETGMWNISAGARFNNYMNMISDETLGKVTLRPSALVGTLAVLRQLNRSSSLFVSAGNGFRAPNVDDLGTLGIVDFRFETPNLSLKPEQSFQYQAGYKLRTRNLTGEAYFYRNELYNLIVRNRVDGETREGYPVYIKENVERAYINGIETAWDLNLTKTFILSGNLTYTFGQNITKDEPMRRIPPLFGRMAAEFDNGKFNGAIELLTASKQERLAKGDTEDNRIPEGGTPGWNVFNINAAYTYGFVTFNLSILNLLNEDYRYHGSGVNAIGRSAFLTVSVNW